MDPQKTAAIASWPKPAPGNVTQVRRFLGFCNYYRKFIHNFSCLARPLHNLTKKDCAAAWDERCDEAFEALKQRVAAAPVLAHFQPEQQILVECNASDSETAGVLSQRDEEGQLHPVAYFSKCQRR